MDTIALIKQRLGMRELLSTLGMVEERGFIRSPYKDERTPSCKIYHRTNSFYDYSTSQGGDVIALYAAYYGLDTKQAVHDLAKLLNLGELTEREKVVTRPVVTDTGDIISAMTEDEREYYYERTGMDEPEMKVILEVKKIRLDKNKVVLAELERYLRKEGWNKHAMYYMVGDRKFAIDFVERNFLFVNDYFATNGHLKKNFSPEELRRTGLISEKGNLIFAAHRILIPYRHNDETIYLRGRYFDSNDEHKTDRNKYLGQKDDALRVNTARRMYNTDVFKNILPFEKLHITEGEMDAAILTQHRFNAVAIPGVGNMPDETKLKQLLMYNIVLCLDRDEAGGKLRQLLQDFFISHNKEISEKILPDGCKDINDYIRTL